MKTIRQATQGNGFAALSIRDADRMIQASVDDLGLAGLVDLRAQIDISRETAFGFEVVRTERRWFSTQDEAATWITSQILAA